LGRLLPGRNLLLIQTTFFCLIISKKPETNQRSVMQILKPHVSLNVRNIEAAVDFYSRMFATTPRKQRPGYAKFDLEHPNLNLTMEEIAATPSGDSARGLRNVGHFGVQVANTAEVTAQKVRLEAAGFATFVEQDVTCCYAVQDKVWVEDPDGNAWEYFFVKADAEVLHPAQVAKVEPQAASTSEAPCCAPSCCVPTVVSELAGT
jgi:catechol 2,3-dioxygenase-like lactoylglutathione lyase family enzyme